MKWVFFLERERINSSERERESVCVEVRDRERKKEWVLKRVVVG